MNRWQAELATFFQKMVATLLPKLVESKTLDSETLHNI